MKVQCSLCKKEIEITQSERAKHGLKKFDDHRAECVKKLMQDCTSSVLHKPTPPVPDKFDMQAIIGYLHNEMGKIPSETDVLRFNMLLETNPTPGECQNFVKLLGGDR
jgi:hypothetical protein